MRLPALLLTAILPLCACDIFIEDWGGEGAPCFGPADCQKGFICEGNICHKPPDQTPFGTKCQPQVQDSCKGEFVECVCFPGTNCYCTRPCGNAHDCDDIQIGGSSARCTLMDPLAMAGVCADWQWTGSYGNLCIQGSFECDNGQCVIFQAGGTGVCTTTCPPACPEEYTCEPAANPQEPFCGLACWFGFWHGCTSDSVCATDFPSYPICRNNQNCTRECDSNIDCPHMSHCVNPPTGNCVPDL
jgi:hypothetical protein